MRLLRRSQHLALANRKDTIMLTVAKRKPFVPNAVFIPSKDGKEGRDFDRSDCTLLFVDGEFQYAEVFTEEAWKNGGEAGYIQRRGDFFLPDDTEIPLGRVQLLPDACIVKIPERDYWCDPDVLAMTTRISGVYALDRRQHFHLCEFCTPTSCGSSKHSTTKFPRSPTMTTSETT